jgi:hypothetical protein
MQKGAMACKYLISRPFYFSVCAQPGKIVHSSGVETEYFNAGGGVRLSPCKRTYFSVSL